MHSDLLVSAIMPTRGRCKWALDAVRMFQSQTWKNKELIIIDDMMEPSFPHGMDGDGIHHYRLPRITIGGKRNLAISRSSGDIIMHWDSDDIYSDDRMESQVTDLLCGEWDMCGYNEIEFVDDEQRKRYLYTGIEGYCVGVSMAYWRDTWEKQQFADIDKGEDNQFAHVPGRRTHTVKSNGRIIARIHSGNTCDKREGIVADKLRWVTLPY